MAWAPLGRGEAVKAARRSARCRVVGAERASAVGRRRSGCPQRTRGGWRRGRGAVLREAGRAGLLPTSVEGSRCAATWRSRAGLFGC